MESSERIASNILADRLKKLENEDIISSKDDPQNKKKIIYRITKKGIGLVPLLLEMISWGAKHDKKTAAPKDFIERLKKDRVGLIEEIIASLKTRIN